MPAIKFSHVATFSSEDSVFRAQNLLYLDGTKKWRCADPGEAQANVVLQLERPTRISAVDVGNDGSAFVEVQVSRAGSPEGSFKTLLPSASFMSPLESRNGQCQNRVRMFGKGQLSQEVAREKWDRVKVVCTQPFNKRVKYGLSFLALSAEEDRGKAVVVEKQKPKDKVKLGAFTLKDEDDEDAVANGPKVGSLFCLKKQKEDTDSVSVGAELRSKQTLASLALARAENEHRRKAKDEKRPWRPLDQLKTSRSKGDRMTPPSSSSQKRKREEPESIPKKLPRRDIVPGEDPPVERANGRRSEKEKPRRASSSQKEKKNSSKKSPLPRQYKPFSRLLEGVVFTISGYQNPLRGELRQKALAMGAKYRSDWDSSCTHLVCAFVNTPKFNQVKKFRGSRIVKKDWVEHCHKDRKRYPWRKFCLDVNDGGDESDAEIWEEKEEKGDGVGDDEDLDTDEEIEKIKKEEEAAAAAKKKKKNGHGNGKPDKESSGDEAYEVDTDVDEDQDDRQVTHTHTSSTKYLPYPELPDFFSARTFYLYGQYSSELRKHLTRLVVAAGGRVSDYMGRSVDFVVTDLEWNDDFEQASRQNPGLHVVTPDFVSACWSESRLWLPPKEEFRVKENGTK